MAFLGETFGVDDLPQSDRNYELIPEGWYNVSITKAELGTTKAGTGQKIDIRYDITGPSQQGRVVFQAVNIRNQSQKAEEIGRQQLGDIMRAIGLAKVNDTDQLIGGHVNIKLAIRDKRTDEKTGKTYDASNEVKAYRAINGGAAPAFQAAAPAAAPAASAPAKAAPPWAKK